MQSVGSCTVTTCVGLSWSDAGAGGDGGGGTDGGTFVSAGTIAVTGGTGPITPTLNSIGEYSYMSQSPGDPTIAGGTPLRISASGATAAAFTANITMPDDIVVTTPAQPSSFTTPIALSRSAGLNVAWTGGGVGDVIVALGQAGIATSVSCQFPSSAGNGTVPAAALAALVPTGAHGNPTTIVTIEPLARETVTQGGWQVSITAEASGGFAAEAAVE